MFKIESKVFSQRLLETIAWCSTQDLSDNGSMSLRKTTTFVPIEGICLPDDKINLNRLYISVSEARHRLLIEKNINQSLFNNNLYGGRLILFCPDTAFAMDGVMKLESGGFFDYCDFSAWDSWVYYISENSDINARHSYIISWIPPQLIHSVSNAMSVNCDQFSTRWLDDIDLNDKDFFNKAIPEILD